MITIGLDLGSRNTKIVVYDHLHKSILHSAWCFTDLSPRKSSDFLIANALAELQLTPDQVDRWAATGYGRKLMHDTCKVFSEITCHAAGCLHLHPSLKTIIDIGGQDSKVICLGEDAKIQEFIMNDKCAAGTGRFLEMTAQRLNIDVDQLSALAATSTCELKLNSTCVVFAESEIIGMIASELRPADIARAVHHSISHRIILQMAGLNWQEPLGFTGGVAMNDDLTHCLGEVLNCQVWRPDEPEITAALGAAILA